VVVRTEGGLRPDNHSVWFERDGTARFDGVRSGRRGRFSSRVNYAEVERLLADAELCTRPVALVHAAGMDVFGYRVSVRCGDAWRHFMTYDAFTPPGNTQVRDAARRVNELASTLTWSPTSDDIQPPVPGAPPR
jgi:hypothetical protein